MDDFDRARLRGLHELVHVGVEEVASLVERHHRKAADGTFDRIESIAGVLPGVVLPVRVVRVVHDATTTVTYSSIRGINRLVAFVGGKLHDAVGGPSSAPRDSDTLDGP